LILLQAGLVAKITASGFTTTTAFALPLPALRGEKLQQHYFSRRPNITPLNVCPVTADVGTTCLMTAAPMTTPHYYDYSELTSWLIVSSSSGDAAATIQSIAGKFFQISLLPYLVFLYFLGFKGNRTAVNANFGFQYLLVFVAAGIFGGVLTESTYGCILANSDWLHGGSEALLTISNILIVSALMFSPVRRVKRVAYMPIHSHCNILLLQIRYLDSETLPFTRTHLSMRTSFALLPGQLQVFLSRPLLSDRR